MSTFIRFKILNFTQDHEKQDIFNFSKVLKLNLKGWKYTSLHGYYSLFRENYGDVF